MQGFLRRAASAGLVLACLSCTTINTSGNSGVSSTNPSTTFTPNPSKTATPGPTGSSSSQSNTGTTVTPANIVTLSLVQTSLELNAPYSYGGFQAGVTSGLSQTEVAGYPTSFQMVPQVSTDTNAAPNWDDLVWSSSNPELVLVDQTGWVHTTDPGSMGNATITVQVRMNLALKATASVVVRNDGKLSLELK